MEETYTQRPNVHAIFYLLPSALKLWYPCQCVRQHRRDQAQTTSKTCEKDKSYRCGCSEFPLAILFSSKVVYMATSYIFLSLVSMAFPTTSAWSTRSCFTIGSASRKVTGTKHILGADMPVGSNSTSNIFGAFASVLRVICSHRNSGTGRAM